MEVHPSHLLTNEEITLAYLWREYRGGGFGNGPLPFHGGTAEQPALVMDAFGALSHFAAILEPGK